ncbi:hypothetical protein ACI2L1_12465 [Streptomyces sp. NPDC019531]|uniref:hypothetical protein n=1 Tax=Streptomyces sp. NPDC019531 TaxID=3365062 RepID=UPI00384E48EF
MTSAQERFRVAVSCAGGTIMRGWWSDQEVAREKFRNWIGSHGNLTQPLITLTDEIDGILLTSWPEESQPPAMLTAMTNEHSDTDASAEPDEHASEQGVGDEPIPPITSDWAPEVGEYRISTA